MRFFFLFFWLSISALTASAQHIMAGEKLPPDFQIVIDDTGTIQFGTYRRYTISANGAVAVEYKGRGLPVQRAGLGSTVESGRHLKNKEVPPAKAPTRKKRVSKKQLVELARAFDSSSFFQMEDRYYGDPRKGSGMCINHAAAKEISVTAHGKTKHVYFFLGCTYGEYAPLKEFLALYNKAETAIRNVKATEIQPPSNRQ